MNGPFPHPGVFPALITPMHEDGSLDLAVLAEHIENMLDAGVHGLVALGSTGEFYALDAGERRAVLETTIRATRGRVPILAGTNSASTREVIQSSVEAQEMGAEGLLLAPPYYSLPTSHELFEHYKLVDQAVSIPIMLYNFPARTGVDLDVDLVEQLCELENVQAIKESTGDIARFRALSERAGSRISRFCGADAIPLQCFDLGAEGWIAGIANVLPREHVEIYELHRDGRREDARVLFDRISPLLDLIEHSGCYVQLVKGLWGTQNQHADKPRLPLLPPHPDSLQAASELLLQVIRRNR